MLVEINWNRIWTQRETHKTVESGIIDNYSKKLITYGKTFTNNGKLHEDLINLANTESEDRVLFESYKTPVDVVPHVQVTIDIIKNPKDKVSQVEIPLKFFT